MFAYRGSTITPHQCYPGSHCASVLDKKLISTRRPFGARGFSMRSRWWQLTVLIGAFFVLTILAVAQSATTSLRGTITDSKGAVVQSGAVTLSNSETGFTRTTKSGGDGVYQFLEVPPATYSLTVSISGFATIKRDKVTLQVSQPATIDITMEVKGTTEVIEVTSEAPLVNTTDASQGNVFNSVQLTSLPSEGRDPVGILSLQAGVTFLGSNTNFDNSKPNQTADSRGGAVAGARSDQTNVTVDGLDNNDQLQGYAFQGALRVPLDSIQEFRVTTTNSNADSGRSSGAQVNMVTKSGTNSFHGTLYEYNRSGIGQANDWFNKRSELQAGNPNVPPHLVRNTFGGSIGGPIVKNRFFFFATYEGQRTHESAVVTRIVPSASLRKGLLTYFCDTTAPNCPSNGLFTLTPPILAQLDPNCSSLGTCPQGPGVDPAALAVFNSYPLPNNPTGGGDGINLGAFTFSDATPAKLDTYILKLDY